MKKLLNTLFVTTQGAYLAKEGETVAVNVERETRLRVPVHTLGGIVCFGNVAVSPFLMGHCADHGVGMSFLTENGRFLAMVKGPQSGNVLLRREQYRRADDPEASARIAGALVAGKVLNCRTVLLRAARDHSEKVEDEALNHAATLLRRVAERAVGEPGLDEVRGLEGDGARVYFGAFDHLITAQKDCFGFRERNRRPPPRSCELFAFIRLYLARS